MRRAVFEGYRHGRSAAWLPGEDWEALLTQPVEAVRAQFAVKPATCNHAVLTTVARGGAAAMSDQQSERCPDEAYLARGANSPR